MAKRYDPIMCMLVDEPTKAQDAEFQMYGPEFHHPIIKASSKEEAIKKAKEIYGWGGKVEAVKVSDEKHLDKAIKTCDGATGDKLYADVKAIYNLFSNILLTYSNEQSVQKLANEGTKKCLELAAKVKGVRDEAIKTCDAVDVDRISNYLWLWVEGREVASMLFNEGIDKYSGPHDKEHKDEAYDFAKKYAQKELDALYSKLKSSVEKKLKEGYANIKNTSSSAK